MLLYYNKNVLKQIKAIKKVFRTVSDNDTGEVFTLVADKIIYQNSHKAFTKVYHGNYEVIKTLTYPETQVFLFIVYNMKMKRRTITLGSDLFDFSKPKYYRAINGLMSKKIIFKEKGNNYFSINTDFIFNGQI